MELEKTSVNVIGVYPGGVKTKITLNALKAEKEPDYAKEFDKKLKMPPDRAAQIILYAILNRKKKVIIGKDARLAIFVNKYLPFLYKKVAQDTMRKFKV